MHVCSRLRGVVLCVQLSECLGQDIRTELYTHRAGCTEDSSEDNRHCGDSLHVQRTSFQVSLRRVTLQQRYIPMVSSSGSVKSWLCVTPAGLCSHGVILWQCQELALCHSSRVMLPWCHPLAVCIPPAGLCSHGVILWQCQVLALCHSSRVMLPWCHPLAVCIPPAWLCFNDVTIWQCQELTVCHSCRVMLPWCHPLAVSRADCVSLRQGYAPMVSSSGSVKSWLCVTPAGLCSNDVTFWQCQALAVFHFSSVILPWCHPLAVCIPPAGLCSRDVTLWQCKSWLCVTPAGLCSNDVTNWQCKSWLCVTPAGLCSHGVILWQCQELTCVTPAGLCSHGVILWQCQELALCHSSRVKVQ